MTEPQASRSPERAQGVLALAAAAIGVPLVLAVAALTAGPGSTVLPVAALFASLAAFPFALWVSSRLGGTRGRRFVLVVAAVSCTCAIAALYALASGVPDGCSDNFECPLPF